MNQVTVHNKSFRLYLPKKKIKKVVKDIAERINIDYDSKNPLFICILNGAFIFASDLFKKINLKGAEITFVKMASYKGIQTTGIVKEIIGLNENIEGKDIIIIEDIVDTGITIESILSQLKSKKPESIKIASLLVKPDALEKNVNIDYSGFEISNDFVIGYGLDYEGKGRNLSNIYKIIN